MRLLVHHLTQDLTRSRSTLVAWITLLLMRLRFLELQCFTDVVEGLGLQSKVAMQVTLFASLSNLAAAMGIHFVRDTFRDVKCIRAHSMTAHNWFANRRAI
jgi:hypothetical protein